MKKILVLALVLALILGIGATAYASTADSDLENTVREFVGNFRNGFGMKSGTIRLDKELLDEFKDLTSEEQLELLEEKLANEDITETQYDRIKLMIENGCTFDPALDGTGFKNGFVMKNGIGRFDKELIDEFKDLTSEEQLELLEEKLANEDITEVQYDSIKLMIENGCTFDPALDGTGFKNGFGMRNGIGRFDKELLDEFKDLTSEEQLDLLEEKLANEDITEVQYDRLKLMIENGCTFDPALDGTGLKNGKGFRMGNGMKNGKGMKNGGGNRLNSTSKEVSEDIGIDL